MGGGYYDRDDNISSSYVAPQTSSNVTNNEYSYSSVADQKVGHIQDLDPSLDPKRWKEKKLTCSDANPIVFALDVTGSMGEWSKIIYDKLPMFFGQMIIQKYLLDPSISFCAVGDVKTDGAPLQISEFAKGCGLDESICKLYLEGNGGGNNHESYDIAAYFYVTKVDLINQEIPFFFLTCDEFFWEDCSNMNFTKVFGHKIPTGQQKLDTLPYWKLLSEKYNIFVLRKELSSKALEPNVHKKWCEHLGVERVLKISNPKAVIDVILGAISITSGSRDLNTYKEDMINRGQTEERIQEVIGLITPYYEALKNGNIKVVKNPDYKPPESMIHANDFSEIKEYFLKAILEFSSYNISYYQDLIKLSQELEGKIPEEIICPLTQSIYCEPVKASNGKIYEKIAIEKWMQQNPKDPITGENLIKNYLTIDYMTKEKVSEFYENSKCYLDI